MANIIEMPKLSDTMTVGTLIKWLKKEGDPVKTGDALAEVETDKATMELESFFDGTLLAIFAREGSQVEIGTALCAVGPAGEKVEAPAGKTPPAAPPAPAKAEAPQPAVAPAPAPAQAAPAPASGAPKAAAAPASGAPQPAPAPAPATPKAPAAPVRAEASGRIRISPLARKLAAEKGIDPSGITGSGPGGRIVRADVLAAPKSSGPAAGAGPPQLRAAVASGRPIQEEKLVPVSNIRGTIARRLLESKTQMRHD